MKNRYNTKRYSENPSINFIPGKVFVYTTGDCFIYNKNVMTIESMDKNNVSYVKQKSALFNLSLWP